jgi:hypothetical protein
MKASCESIPKEKKKMLRKMFFVLATLAMLTGMMVINRSAKASPDMQTITLNTGFNHVTQKVYATGTLSAPFPDLYWTLINPSGTPLHSAYNIKRHPAWSPPQVITSLTPQGTSQWISFSGDGIGGLVVKGSYYYQKCFCLTRTLWDNPEAIQQSILDVSVRADDFFYLGLNTIPDKNNPSTYFLATNANTGEGGFVGKPAAFKIMGDDLVKRLRPGRNCLSVRVDDIGGAISGLNLVGSLTTTGIDGIAKAATPKSAPQFDSCSSCSKIKFDKDAELKNEGAIRGILARPPEK